MRIVNSPKFYVAFSHEPQYNKSVDKYSNVTRVLEMNNDMNGRDLSNCEKLIMKIVWDASEDISTQEIIDVIRTQYDKDYARTTVVTFLQRLTEKGFVTTYRKGRISYVHPIRDEEQYKDHLLKHIEEFWFKGDVSNLLSALCKRKKPSTEEIARMREIIDELDN